MKVSIIVPVYQDGDILESLYNDLKSKVFDKADFDYEIVLVNDGSTDDTLDIMYEMSDKYDNIKIISLSRNFGAYAAVLAGLSKCTGDCAVTKAADLQEPSELIFDMVKKWEEGSNVVLAVREQREESKLKVFFSNLYYVLVRKFVTQAMPKTGFDIFLLDRKVIEVLLRLDERNSSIIIQILWSGFRTAKVPYVRLNREEGISKWTLKKKIRLVLDTLFSFSNVPIKLINIIGTALTGITFVIDIILIILKLVCGYRISYITIGMVFILFCIGLVLNALGILGEYLWRTLDASRNRPVYLIEEEK